MPTTRTRVLAGYLLRDQSGSVVSVPYCELHAHCASSALFAMYESESCGRVDGIIPLTVSTPIMNVREDTPCFSLNSLQLCARTVKEKNLWLRALENVQVKILNEAPNPSSEELAQWRRAVLACAAEAASDEEWTQEARACASAASVASGDYDYHDDGGARSSVGCSRSPGRSIPPPRGATPRSFAPMQPAQMRHRHRVHLPSPVQRQGSTTRSAWRIDSFSQMDGAGGDTLSIRSHASTTLDTTHSVKAAAIQGIAQARLQAAAVASSTRELDLPPKLRNPSAELFRSFPPVATAKPGHHHAWSTEGPPKLQKLGGGGGVDCFDEQGQAPRLIVGRQPSASSPTAAVLPPRQPTSTSSPSSPCQQQRGQLLSAGPQEALAAAAATRDRRGEGGGAAAATEQAREEQRGGQEEAAGPAAMLPRPPAAGQQATFRLPPRGGAATATATGRMFAV